MNHNWTRRFRSIYRKEPISGFLLTIGAVDAVIGGAGSHWLLMALGLGTVAAAAALRWWLLLPRSIEPIAHPAIRYLPPPSSRPGLPTLNLSTKQPPR